MNIIALLFFIALIGSMWLLPSATPMLGIALLLFSVIMATSAIFKKHKGSEKPSLKIAKDISIFILTLLIISFLGGIAGLFANTYASLHFGTVAGIVSAIAASFAVGYLVKKGMGKITGN